MQAGRIDDEQMTVDRRHSLSPKSSQNHLVSLLDQEQTSLVRRRGEELREHNTKQISEDRRSFKSTVPVIQAVIKFKKPLCKCYINKGRDTKMENVSVPAIKLIPSTPVRHGAHHLNMDGVGATLPEVDNDSQMHRKHRQNKHCRTKLS